MILTLHLTLCDVCVTKYTLFTGNLLQCCLYMKTKDEKEQFVMGVLSNIAEFGEITKRGKKRQEGENYI